MTTPTKRRDPVGSDGLTKRQRYIQNNITKIRASNAERMRKKRAEKKAEQKQAEMDDSISASDKTLRIMKDQAVDASPMQTLHVKSVDGEAHDGPPSVDSESKCMACRLRVLSCDRCEWILQQHAPVKEFLEIKSVLEDARSQMLQAALSLQEELAVATKNM